MEKIKNLNLYQKGVILFMIAISLLFAVIYQMTIRRVGFEYKDEILVPVQEQGSTVYSGKIKGKQARFIVSDSQTVVFQYGDKTYGPYTAEEDPTAVPEDEEMTESMTGVEIRQGEEILFRGGVLKTEYIYWLYNEDGGMEDGEYFYVTVDGIRIDENGREIDPMEPTADVILKILDNPKLTHKGEWFPWFAGVGICILNIASILFADELFRWNLSFQIRNADSAEPSEWEIAGRYLGWTVLAICALVMFITGLE